VEHVRAGVSVRNGIHVERVDFVDAALETFRSGLEDT